MDFFEHQEIARRRTGRLIVYFGLAVAGTVAAVYFLAVGVLAVTAPWRHPGVVGPSRLPSLWNPQLFAGVAVATLGVIFLGSLYKTWELAGGGESVALLLGGRPVSPQSEDLAQRRLLNVVEEMALASGIPVPPVFVLEAFRPTTR
jgi:hypothetical protein